MAEAKQPTIKRECYRLTDLDKSPFNLSLEDALHLGSTHRLPIYVRITKPVLITSREIHPYSDEYRSVVDSNFFLCLDAGDIAHLEKVIKVPRLGWDLATRVGEIDERFYFIPGLEPLAFDLSKRTSSHKVKIETYTSEGRGYDSDLYIYYEDLLCFTEDLEQLLNNEPTPKAASPETPLHPRRQQTYLTLIEALLLETLNEIPSEPYKAAGILQTMLDKQGLALNKESIAKTIKEILQARGERLP